MNAQTAPATLKAWIQQRCNSTLDFKFIIQMVTRCLRAYGRPNWEERVRENPKPLELQATRQLIFYCFMEKPRELLAKGDLATLGAWQEKGMVYVRGRFSPTIMNRLVGSDKLPLIIGTSRLAYLLAWESHLEDHNLDVKILLARIFFK